MVLHDGAIAEMRTGEGKTLVATLAATSTRWRARASTSSPSTTTSPSATPSGWAGSTASSACPSASSCTGSTTRSAPSLRRRHHLRHQQRVRLRLPARQHEVRAAPDDAARAQLRDRRRGRLDPHRRGAHAAHHLRPVRRQVRALQLVDKVIPALAPEDFDLDEKRAPPTSRRPATSDRGAAARARRPDGGLALRGANVTLVHHVNQALRAHKLFQRDKDYIVRRRRGRHHRRVHRAHDARPPLFGRAAPGARGQGAGRGPARERDAGLHHLPELLPPLQEARRHDRHGGDRGRRVRRDLQARRRRDPDQQAGAAPRRATTRSTAPTRRS